MTAASPDHPLTLDHALLQDPVRRALGRATVEVLDWQVRPFGNSASFLTGGIYHVQGRARDGDHDLLWSVILKILPETAAYAVPAGVRYWRREALCYASGLLDDLPGGVATPALPRRQ